LIKVKINVSIIFLGVKLYGLRSWDNELVINSGQRICKEVESDGRG